MTISRIGLTTAVAMLLVIVAQNLNISETTNTCHKQGKSQDHPTKRCHILLLGIRSAALVERMQHDACYPDDSTQSKQGN